ncbi:MAG: hypothetical protein ACJ74J_01610 [Blastocatellia bacterium]
MASIIDPKVNGAEIDDPSSDQQAKRAACIELLNQWLADESGYDEKTWPKIKNLLEENRTSDRPIFNE